MNIKKDFLHISEMEMKNLARSLAKILKIGDVCLFHGDLGAGKTAFARMVIRAFINDEDLAVPSPTFNLVQQYDVGEFDVWHFDLYRLSCFDDVIEIGYEDALSSGVSLIEWPDRLESYIPKNRIDIYIDFVDGEDNLRDIRLEASGSLAERVAEWDYDGKNT